VVEKPASKETANLASEVAHEAESQDVNIKLDLVAAYIDMDDKEGARELLEEILKEGGPQQQSRAKELLNSLA
jgi:pilus assembly protein FimV